MYYEQWPNEIAFSGGEFYISYNAYDTAIYGGDTTALVLEQDGNPCNFYILDGDHRKEYAARIKDGVEACLLYFTQNSGVRSKYSDVL